jgi:hypothetical protein
MSIDEEPPDQSLAPTYYPGTTSRSSASAIPLALGQERLDVDLVVGIVRTATIEGQVAVAAAGKQWGGTVMLAETDGGFQPRYRARFGEDGAFRLTGVPPGDYVLVAQADVEGVEGCVTSRLPIGVAGVDVTGVSLPLVPGATVSGRVVVEGTSGAASLDPDRIEVVIESADPEMPRQRASQWPGPALTFTVSNVAPGPQRVRVGRLPGGWRLKSALLGSVDVADLPFDVVRPERIDGLTLVLTDVPTSLSGHVTDERGAPVSDLTVVVFPDDSALWQPGARRLAGARPDQTGRFEVTDLPSGEYRLAALELVEDGEWNDPTFLDRVRPTALSVTIADGQPVVRDLVVRQTRP